MSLPDPNHMDDYSPDRRLEFTYDEANLLDEAGLEALCPSYIELSEVSSRYEDGSLLGQGAVKDVYRTFDSRAKRWVAMARLRENRGPEYYDLFVHEAWLTSSLSHPNIIKVYDVGVSGEGGPYFTMDLKGNTSLADLVGEQNNPGLEELLNIFTKVCDAMAYAHSKGVIHLDLKPENIQTDDFGETLVCDWGLGKVTGGTEEREHDIPDSLQTLDNMTLVGQIKGTPGYMAPEQVTPGSEKGVYTDIFALGCLLHTILTGLPPFLGSRATVLDATSRANIVPPRIRYPNKGIPESLEAVVMKAMAREPGDRYPSVMDLKGEVVNFMRGFSTRAERPGFFREMRLFLGRHRVPALITCIAILGISVLSVLFVQRLERQINATEEEQDRGAQLAIEAGFIQNDYDLMLERSKQSRKELAGRLAKSSKSLKNMGIFQRPVTTVREANELAALALNLDPECSSASFQKFSLSCIALNFKDALTYSVDEDQAHGKYMEFAKAFPRFSFGEKSRPTEAQLTSFFKQAREINASCAPLMERILTYDYATGRDSYFYEKIIVALLEYLNGGEKHLICQYDPLKKSFFLWSDQNLRMLVPEGSGSGACFLRFVPITSLKLDVAGRFDLSGLNRLVIQSLDISKCDNVVLNKPVSLPLLGEIKVRQGQFNPELLRQVIITRKNLTIIEVPQK